MIDASPENLSTLVNWLSNLVLNFKHNPMIDPVMVRNLERCRDLLIQVEKVAPSVDYDFKAINLVVIGHVELQKRYRDRLLELKEIKKHAKNPRPN